MTHRRQLRGIELRYALTLIEALDYQGFDIPGRSSKVVSDALRSEIAHGRTTTHSGMRCWARENRSATQPLG
jgi:hypothetical protein